MPISVFVWQRQRLDETDVSCAKAALRAQIKSGNLALIPLLLLICQYQQYVVTQYVAVPRAVTVRPRSTGIHENMRTRVHGYTATRTHGNMGTRVHGYTATRTHGDMGTRVHGYTATRTHGNMDAWVYWSMVTLVHGYTGTQVHRHTGACVHRYIGTRIHA